MFRRPARRRAQELIAADGNPPATYTTALALLQLVRDSANTVANWSVALDFVRKLPDHFANEPEIQEIRAFAAAQGGDNVQAIAELQTLIALTGPTPERLGLLGGRYKRLSPSGGPRRFAGSHSGSNMRIVSSIRWRMP